MSCPVLDNQCVCFSLQVPPPFASCRKRPHWSFHQDVLEVLYNTIIIDHVLHVCRLIFVETETIITQKAAIALEPLTTHPDEWAEPSHK